MVKKLPGINGLRAISVILVIIHHLFRQYPIVPDIQFPFYLKPFISFIQDGHLGVNVFFVISGYLITSLLLDEEKASGSISIKNFYMRRILRIFPAYYFLLLFYFVLQLCGHLQLTNASWLTALTYTKYINWKADWYTAHAWSLSIEEQFYLCWPFVFMSGPMLRKIFAIFLILFVPMMRIYLHLHPLEWITELHILMRIDAIAMGCFFALYKDRILTVLSRNWRLYFFISISLLFVLRALPILFEKVHLGFIWVPLGSTHGSVANFLNGCILMYTIFAPQAQWARFLNSKIMNAIGVLSYSIYLWQEFFIVESDYWYNKMPLNLLLIIVMSVLSYYCIEQPFLKLKNKFQPNK